MVAKVTALFSRVVPFYLIPSGQASDHEQFDAYPVTVSPTMLLKAVKLREMKNKMDDLFMDMPAPEENTQAEADTFIELLKEL